MKYFVSLTLKSELPVQGSKCRRFECDHHVSVGNRVSNIRFIRLGKAVKLRARFV